MVMEHGRKRRGEGRENVEEEEGGGEGRLDVGEGRQKEREGEEGGGRKVGEEAPFPPPLRVSISYNHRLQIAVILFQKKVLFYTVHEMSKSGFCPYLVDDFSFKIGFKYQILIM